MLSLTSSRTGDKSSQRGDTLIEVLFAITIFSMVVVAVMSLMNQGVSASRRSLEMTLVRDQIDAQATSLRLMHQSYVTAYKPDITYSPSDLSPAAQYYNVIQHIKAFNLTQPSPTSGLTSCPTTTPSGAFFVNPRTTRFINSAATIEPSGSSYSQVSGANDSAMTAKGIWIEGLRTAQDDSDPLTSNAGYIDFHIKACWYAPGLDLPMSMGTIVRLYEPRG